MSLAAPTGWPDALQTPARVGAAWAAQLRTLFADFFAKTAALSISPSLGRP